MCGVFGYVGKEKNLSKLLLDGISKLEYRGYDSAGIAVFKKGNKPQIYKEVGELSNLKKTLGNKKIFGEIGIAHTRWATHGGVNKKNAHPHTDCSGRIAVVHNGIIENYEKIRKNLQSKGHRFLSETDTEVVPHLIEEKLKNKKLGFVEAVRKSFKELQGLNAIVACSDTEIVAFRKGSPLVAGVGKAGNFISSDIPGLLSETRNLVLIDEKNGVLITKENIFTVNIKSGKIQKSKPQIVNMEETHFDKGSFPHFLLKEIYEEPEVVARVATNNKQEIEKAISMIKKAWGIYFTACGTAAHAGLAATYFFSEIASSHVNFVYGSEFPYFQDFLVSKSLLIVASQSGETMDTLEAVRAAKKHHSKILALVNVPGSSLSRLSDFNLLLKAGPERAVLSTKAYIAKLAVFLLFVYALAKKFKEGINLLKKTSKNMSGMFRDGINKEMKVLAKKLVKEKDIYLIGRGVNYATALEGALKIKEASYIHAEGFAGGELKHGVIALIEKGTPCIAIVANDEAKEAILSNATELASRGGFIIGISPAKEEVFDYWIKVPDVGWASPIVNILPLQLLAYHLAVFKGYNPDKPRNLAKSVTVK